MRKIIKTILNVSYENWITTLTKNNQIHPKYNSSKGKYYYSIIANLIIVQEGLCAYTERRMQNYTTFDIDTCKSTTLTKFEFAGQLDHFDASLKEQYGWQWDNFFLIDSDVNVKAKRSIKPYGHLKPDKHDFKAADFLEYDVRLHTFIPNKKQPFHIQNEVFSDIKCLGLNFQPIIDLRREYLQPIIDEVRFQQKTFDEAKSKLHQYFTAFELSKNYMTN